MAIPEACGLWIEQRLKEEIEETGNTRKSVNAIAKMVTQEVNRVFETDINPETIRSKTRRLKGWSNDQKAEKTVKPDSKPVSLIVAIDMMNEEIGNGATIQQAARTVGEKTGRNVGSIRTAHYKASKKNKQETKWKIAERDLKKLIKYMMENCEVPAVEVDTKILNRFCNNVDTLQIYCDEMKKGE